MQIDIPLTKKSINDAIEILAQKKQKVADLIPNIITRSLEKIKDLANDRVLASDIGINVKNDIMENWIIGNDTMGDLNNFTLYNLSKKSAYVEFGVGIVGQRTPHPSAIEAGYEYNMPSLAKNELGVWRFFTNRDDLDMPLSKLKDVKKFENDKRGRMKIWTSGVPGEMFLFNACMDFVQGNYIEQIFSDEVEKFWSD